MPHGRISVGSRTRQLLFRLDRRLNRKRLAEVRRLQKRTTPLLKRAPFDRIIRGMLCRGQRFSNAGGDALREAADHYMHRIMQLSALAAEHGGRQTTTAADMWLVWSIQQRAARC